MDPVKRSLVTLHFTVILLGGTGLFSHLIRLNAGDITLARSVFACLSLFAFLKMSQCSLSLASRKERLVALLLGGLMTLHWVTYFAAMQYSSVSVGMIALFTFPVITVLIEPIFEKSVLAWQDLVSAMVVVVGIGLIVPEVSLQNDITLGVIVGVISAVLYSVRNLLHRKHFSHHSGAKAMAWQTLVVSFAMLPFGSAELYHADLNTWLMLALLGTFFTALPHALVASSLRHLRAKTFSLIACMQPLYGVILAMLLLNEKPRWETLVGGILIISASVYETINTHRQSR